MKSPRIITVVPCRTASRRLPQKALLPILNVPSIERCLLNTLVIPSSHTTVLATSMLPEDDALCGFTLGGRVDVVRGSEVDVLERFLRAIDRHQPEHVIRATGDCPVVSFEIAEWLVKRHLSSGADVTYPLPGFAVGTNSEIYSAAALRRLRQFLPVTPHSEYLIFYFTQNPERFKLNRVQLPDEYQRPWRLTIDEPSDLELFERIFSELRIGRRSVAFRELVTFFDAHPHVAQINAENHLKYVHDVEFLTRLRDATRITTDEAHPR